MDINDAGEFINRWWGVGAVLVSLVTSLGWFRAVWHTRGSLGVARSLATGYFYSFINRIGSALATGEIKVKDGPLAGRKFDRTHVRFQCYYPQTLTDAGRGRVLTDISARGATPDEKLIELPDKSTLRVRYSASGSGADTILVLHDLPNTFMTLRFRAEEKLDQRTTNCKAWEKFEPRVQKEFHKQLHTLLEKSGHQMFREDVESPTIVP
jgi:hypothetical protein